MDYRSAGVDIDAATKALAKVREHARSTFQKEVLSDIGSFGGLFRFDCGRYRSPVLVASTDGVGTKLKVAFAVGRHDSVGYDLVSHCVNDILVQGARPLFFLDYLAMGRLDGAVAGDVVSGMARACREFGVTLLGGETAEMPGFYRDGEYDVAGTIIGVVEESEIIDGSGVVPGDRLIGLPSNGLHTNGYSLARKILFEQEGLTPESEVEGWEGTVGEVLLQEHRCYLPALEPELGRGRLKALAHITGGGMTDNLPRVLPKGRGVRIDLDSFETPPLFRYLMQKGPVAPEEMLRAFNVGVGMVAVVAPEHEKALLEDLRDAGAFPLGTVETSERRVSYEGEL